NDEGGVGVWADAKDVAGGLGDVHLRAVARGGGGAAGSGGGGGRPGRAERACSDCSGEMTPRLMMNLMPSATDMLRWVISVSGMSMRKPEVGLGVVGMKTETSFSGPREVCSPVTKARERERACGKGTRTTCLKEDLLLEKEALTCLTV